MDGGSAAGDDPRRRLVWRQHRPLLVLVVVLAANTTYYALGFPLTGFDLALLVALYSVAAYAGQRTSLLAARVTVASFVALYAFKMGPLWSSVPFSFLVWLVAIFAGVWMWGRYVRIRRAYAAELEARAERAERDREAEARRAVAAERARIARELPDVVAHHVSVAVVQAGAARQLLDTDPGRARSALVAIEEAGRRALTAMPSLLRALRADALELRVVDDGDGAPRPAAAGSGHGLVGMRERVALFGGQLHAGPRPGGGFQVVARLPLEAAPPAQGGSGP